MKNYKEVEKDEVTKYLARHETIICADIKRLKMFVLNSVAFSEIEEILQKEDIAFFKKE